MSELTEKSRAFDLYACATSICSVVTFIQVENCPVCNQPGMIIRRADTFEKGPPPDPTRFGAIESETG
jgi:hypothetical protein